MDEQLMARIRELSERQLSVYIGTATYEDWMITFESQRDIMSIVSPFYSICLRFNVDPIKEYGDDFLQSDWLKPEKLDELERNMDELGLGLDYDDKVFKDNE